jgi:hypothetical protein
MGVLAFCVTGSIVLTRCRRARQPAREELQTSFAVLSADDRGAREPEPGCKPDDSVCTILRCKGKTGEKI